MCSIPDCNRPAHARALCKTHYMRLLRHGSTTDPVKPVKQRCAMPACASAVHARGLCEKHYERLRRRGSTELTRREPTRDDDMARFNKYVPHKPEDGCWMWTGSTNHGYGQFYYHGRPHLAHRMAYIFAYGPIPDDQELDHSCHNPACIRPDHVHPVRRSEHLALTYRRDGRKNQWSKKTHCPAGHPYSPENTYVTPKGYRKCVTCRRAEWKQWNARRRAHPTERPDEL